MPQVTAITTRTIAQEQQEYDTVGNWKIIEHHPTGGVLYVDTTDIGDWRMNAAVTVHEIVEALLCANDGVQERDVTRFDVLYEQRRARAADVDIRTSSAEYADALARDFDCQCIPTQTSEPGDDVHAPYGKQHAVATQVERIFIDACGVSWAEYDAQVRAL